MTTWEGPEMEWEGSDPVWEGPKTGFRAITMAGTVLRLDESAMCTVWRVRRLTGNAPGLTGRVLRKVEIFM